MITDVKKFFLALQQKILLELKSIDPSMLTKEKLWESKLGQGIAYSLSDGVVIEKGGVNFSQISANYLPKTASDKRRDLANSTYEAVGLSIVIHPLNPYAPTSHANLRFFITTNENAPSVWWFGGGFDLTPYYG